MCQRPGQLCTGLNPFHSMRKVPVDCEHIAIRNTFRKILNGTGKSSFPHLQLQLLPLAQVCGVRWVTLKSVVLEITLSSNQLKMHLN